MYIGKTNFELDY